MFDTGSLKNRIHNSIHTAEDLLITMMETPSRGNLQINLHTEYLKKMSGLMYKVENDILDIGTVHKAHNNNAELENLSTSIAEIGRNASTIYKNLCTKEEPIYSANLELLHARQTTHGSKDLKANSTADLSKRITKKKEKINTMETILATLPKPVLGLIQKQEHKNKIRRINTLMIKAHFDTMEIMDKYEDDIYATNYLRSSIDSIRHRTPTIYGEDTP